MRIKKEPSNITFDVALCNNVGKYDVVKYDYTCVLYRQIALNRVLGSTCDNPPTPLSESTHQQRPPASLR